MKKAHKAKAHQHPREEHKMQEQEQTQGEQSQKQEIPIDPVHEQVHAYSPPEQGLASDPITEAPKAEPEKTPEPEPKNE